MLKVTARSAADILGIQPNSAALFYRKIREAIVHHLEQESHEIFDGVVELDEIYCGGIRKGKRGRVALLARLRFWHIEAWREGLYKGCWRYQDRNIDAAHY